MPKKLDFNVIKTEEQLQELYKKHDIAVREVMNRLKPRGYSFEPFGMDMRDQRVWAAGEDKPDFFLLKARDQTRLCLCEVKYKTKKKFIVNKRAYDSYLKWSNQLKHLVLVFFYVASENDVWYALLGPLYKWKGEELQWDKNITVSTNSVYHWTKLPRC